MTSSPSSSFNTNRNHQILLLKTPSPTPSTDPYTLAFSSPSDSPTHFTTHYIPLLSHTLLPDPLIQLLLTYLSSPLPSAPFPYGALILTSQRAVAALRTALSCPPIIQQLDHDPDKKTRMQELCMPLYTVGRATALAAQEVVEKYLPGCRVLGGARAGSGEVLARLILGEGPERYRFEEAYNDNDNVTGEDEEQRPILFLAGEKRRDIIPRMLQNPEGRKPIKVTEQVLYRTAELPEFEHTFSQTLRLASPSPSTPARDPGTLPTRWIVLFSPASARTILHALGYLDPDSKGSPSIHSLEKRYQNQSQTFIAAIGPTTNAHLQTHFQFSADVVAPAPSPEGLREGIVKFLQERGHGDGKGGRGGGGGPDDLKGKGWEWK